MFSLQLSTCLITICLNINVQQHHQQIRSDNPPLKLNCKVFRAVYMNLHILTFISANLYGLLIVEYRHFHGGIWQDHGHHDQPYDISKRFAIQTKFYIFFSNRGNWSQNMVVSAYKLSAGLYSFLQKTLIDVNKDCYLT